jgi:hypothetical protein
VQGRSYYGMCIQHWKTILDDGAAANSGQSGGATWPRPKRSDCINDIQAELPALLKAKAIVNVMEPSPGGA